jgi:hypothetical protein
MNRLTDVDIPRSAWSAWKEDNKPRQLRRPLTPEERFALGAREAELAPLLVGFEPRSPEGDRVRLALADMFGSYRSMRQTGEEAMALVEAAMRSMEHLPAWAIEKACRSIQTLGVWRDGKYDREWPPNDSEITQEALSALRLYADPYISVAALLKADVEEDAA